MRNGMAAFCAAGLLLSGCGDDQPEPAPSASVASGPRVGEAEMPEGGLPPLGERAALKRASGSWDQKLTHDATPLCTFTERPVSDRPQAWVVTAWSGNMDLYSDGYALGKDPSARWIEAMFMRDRPVIAARAGMDDVWIEPQGDYSQTLLVIDDKRFTCTGLPKTQ
ncbi:hypothetical protein GRI89_03135 [Altererythrobacter salegens]|uniref:Lipoprotein n=1 Tax=Croceibacterium salegens TaxID=1737568 RepID=A0A6I4SU01_9SPHN|nr:hypothetical protein [Croceibacterium salegens]MXO58537.1 hypothetical protein [Croceibacterium salegens]